MREQRYHNDEPYCLTGCGRSNAMNPVSLGRGQIEWLFRLHTEWGGRADHKTMNLRGSIYATCSYLRYWKLTENYDGVGTFAIRPEGYAFMAGDLLIHKTCWMFDGEIRGFEGPMLSVDDILGQEYGTYESIVADIRARRRTAPRRIIRANLARRSG